MKKRPSDRLLLQLRAEGYSQEKIASLCGVSLYTIRNWIEEAEEKHSNKL